MTRRSRSALVLLLALALLTLLWRSVSADSSNGGSPLIDRTADPNTIAPPQADMVVPAASFHERDGAGASDTGGPKDVSTTPDAPATNLATPPMGRIFGRVFGPDGQPAAERRVRILRAGVGGVLNADTDADGYYDQRELEATRYHISTQPSEAELAAAGREGGLGGLEFLCQESVVLARGEEREVNLGAPPLRPIRVHGRLLGASDGTTAILQWAPEDEFGYDRARYVSTKGHTYELLLDGPGAYHLSAIVRPGSVRVDSNVSVPDTLEFEHDVLLPACALRVAVTNGDGEAVAGASVHLSPRAGVDPIPGMSATSFLARTGKDGGARFGHVANGEWWVTVQGNLGEKLSPLGTASARISIDPTDVEVALELTLQAGGSVRGSVVDAANEPVQGAYVFAFDRDGEPLNPLRGAGSDRAGLFEIKGLSFGTVSLVALRGREASAVIEAICPSPAHDTGVSNGPVNVGPQLRLAPAARIEVDRSKLSSPCWIAVRDGRGNLFSPLVDNNLFGGAYSRRAVTTMSWFDVPAGVYTVEAMASTGVVCKKTVAVIAGEHHVLGLAGP